MKKIILLVLCSVLYNGVTISQAETIDTISWNVKLGTPKSETVNTKKVVVNLIGEIKSVALSINQKNYTIKDGFEIEKIEDEKVKITFDVDGTSKSDTVVPHDGMLVLEGAIPGKGPKLTLTFANDADSIHDPEPSSILSGVTLFKEFKEEEDYCKLMEACTALLILDGASFVSNVSRLYRKNKDGNCVQSSCWGCKHTLKVGDFLKVYIENFNAYLYDIEFVNQFMDVNYGDNIMQKNGSKAEGATTDSNDIKLKIEEYAKASKELKNYLDLMMMNRNPDSKLLSEQKNKIYYNMFQVLKIDPSLNVESLFNKLDSETQEKLKEDYELARNLHVLFYQVMNLSYTHEITVIPIQIRSYDHLSLTIKIRDKKDKSLIREQEYIIPIRGGWKYDQSYGAVIHKINDQQYSLRDSIESGTLIGRVIMEEEKNNLSFGFSTLQHMAYRLTGQFSIGPHIGISADLYPSTELRYLLGGGFSFRDERFKLHLNGGFIFGKYKSVDNLNKLLVPTDLPTFTDKFTTSYYAGISFNVKFDLKNEQTASTEVIAP